MENPYAAPSTDVRQSEFEVAGAAPYTVAEMRAAFTRFAWAYWGYIGTIVVFVAVLVAMGVQLALKGEATSEADIERAMQGWLIGMGIFFIILFIISVLIMIFAMILLYRYWAVMQPYTKRTTPGKAVGFLFIPFFNLYWMFVSYHGLAKDIDEYLDKNRGSTAPRPSSGLVLSMLILFLVSLLAIFGNQAVAFALIGNFASLALTVIIFISKLRLNNSIIGIIQDRSRQMASAGPTK